jgi:hypothetical protein
MIEEEQTCGFLQWRYPSSFTPFILRGVPQSHPETKPYSTVANYHPAPRPLENYRLLARTSSFRTFIPPTLCSVNIAAVSAPVCQWATGEIWTTNLTRTATKENSLFHYYHHQLHSPCKDLWRFNNLIKTLGRTPLDEWLVRHKGLYLRRTTQHRNRNTNIHALSVIRTHDPGKQAAKTCDLDCAATGTGMYFI